MSLIRQRWPIFKKTFSEIKLAFKKKFKLFYAFLKFILNKFKFSAKLWKFLKKIVDLILINLKVLSLIRQRWLILKKKYLIGILNLIIRINFDFLKIWQR